MVDVNGLVVAGGQGSATITVTTVDGTHTATSTITVSPVVSADSLTLNRKAGIIQSGGGTINVIATVLPTNITDRQPISWTSLNPLVASVTPSGTYNTSCVITGGVQGNTVITAEAYDLIASFDVTVSYHASADAIIPVQTILPAGTASSIHAVDATIALTDNATAAIDNLMELFMPGKFDSSDFYANPEANEAITIQDGHGFDLAGELLSKD